MSEEQVQESATEVSMDDFMAAKFDELETLEINPVVKTEPEIGASEAAGETAESDVEAKESTEPETDTSETADEEGEGDEPVKAQTISAPQSMSAKDREAFYALPPEQQTFIAERAKQQEADYTKKTMEIAETRKAYDKLEQVIAPRRQQLAMDGMDESTAIGQLFALSDFANQNPVGFVQYLFQQRGIPLSALTESGAGNQVAADPQLTAMQREIHGLKDYFTRQTQAQQAQQAQSVQTDIQAFAAENQFYSELEADMIPLVAGFRQSHPGLSSKEYLAKAYKAAIAVNDEVAAKVSADESAKRLAETKAAADKAKKATGANLRSRATLPPAAARAKDVDSFIGALVDERMSA
ncbi:MAG: hypothetical protein O3C57_01305 [Verrucomicrobia bacterium]|nr:hypothetical protein [Verrucomicrobiota bacterium]